MEVTDRKLIDRYLGGDRQAFEQIVKRWEHRVLNLAYRLSNDFDEALDIRQLAFMRAFQGLHTFNGEAQFSTWLYKVVLNLSRDRRRAHSSREGAMRGMFEEPPLAGAPSSPERETERQETAHMVADAVAKLPGAEKEVVILKHYHGRTFAEIAAIVGAPASTVKSRMERALKNLRLLLKNLE